MASVVNITNRNLIRKIFLQRQKPVCCRWVATGSGNQKEVSGVVEDKMKYENVTDYTKPLDRKNWVSFGFDNDNPEKDRYKMHSSYFMVLLAIISFTFFTAYAPDNGHRNWAKREAYIRLHEREKLGLDPIDKNYVDPEKMKLPSDEELGDFEIII